MSSTVAAVLRGAVAEMTSAGVPDALRDARRLLAEALAGEGSLAARDALTSDEEARFRAMVAARCARQPVSQIVGRRAFWGRDFRVTGDVLDPRPETETLVERALEAPAPQRMLDLGTGTGCIAISLALAWPDADVTATDVGTGPLEIARANASDHGVAARIRLVRSDWFAALNGCWDLIVSNPPYIPAADIAGLSPEVREWEPHAALTPGGDGLAAYRQIAQGLSDHLAPGGQCLLEFGIGQAPAVAEILQKATGWAVSIHTDLSGHQRIAHIHRPAG